MSRRQAGAQGGHRMGGGGSLRRLRRGNFETVPGTNLRYLGLDSHVSSLACHHLRAPAP